MTKKTFNQESSIPDKHTYEITGDLQVQIRVTNNPFEIPPESLFSMAARINKKRSFLFVSKILGKHLPVQPEVSLLGGYVLALLLQQELQGPSFRPADALEGLRDPDQAKAAWLRLQEHTLTPPRPLAFIGFAETATALGHSMYAAFSSDCRYVHTTREWIPEIESSVNFEEEHSHATSHRCYTAAPAKNKEAIVLVDDELTTGNTVLNIIRELNRKHPGHDFYVASLLDWRTPEHRDRFAELERELGISIKVLAVLTGEMSAVGNPDLANFATGATDQSEPHSAVDLQVIRLQDLFEQVDVSSLDLAGHRNPAPYLLATGRFGIASAENRQTNTQVRQAAARLREMRSGTKTLCLGTGEFMYLPMRIAAEMGEGVWYQSTTRSPIHPHVDPSYAIWEAFSYPSPDDPNVPHFLYNVTRYGYDDLFVFLERPVEQERLKPFVDQLCRLGIKCVRVVILS
ncbi:phosphoribosyltransferase-like predicted ribonucleoside biosynthesis protein [Tumebacillus sp. BK434]|uniref:phosphoribosyltransferase family protein n=1 Tax=Tumebacillus sp. BK434 TaxID=2512169 RepID=UPI0010E5E1FE|nr:phosphoribosyltransferase family protein [Tumebacillus sp. BK434]TCP57926.1 phosphoribosyltransferase-like predicted ribonucleoside biosynthesis protein [Tumebacillus sp. BK434]